MTSAARLIGLPVTALVLVAGVLGIQVANGGGEFEPLAPADPCVERTVTSRAEGIEALSERLVLLGIDGAACRLDVSREALTLELAQPGPRTDEEIDALREGLLAAVKRMKDDGTLPKASDLVDEALENADLNGFLEAADQGASRLGHRRRGEGRRHPQSRDQRPRPARASWPTSMTRTTSTVSSTQPSRRP